MAGVELYDHIQHDYAIRYVNTKTGDYDYRAMVKRGTPYPTPEPVARLTVKASYDGQPQLGLAIFEMGEREATRAVRNQLELVFDPSGAARWSARPSRRKRNAALTSGSTKRVRLS